MAGTQVRTKPDPGDPVANFPKMCPGDTFTERGASFTHHTHRDTFTYTVIRVNEDGSFICFVTTEGDGREEEWTFNNNYERIDAVVLSTGEHIRLATPPMKRLNFPLFVGKEWRDSYKDLSKGNLIYEFRNIYLVTEYTKIKTELGWQDVFKIKRTHRNEDLRNTLPRVQETFYYSPKLKVVIKGYPSWRIGETVISANMQDCGQWPEGLVDNEPCRGKYCNCTTDSDCATGLICKDNGSCVSP